MYRPFATELPELSLFSLNIFGKMALGAMSGFEFVALMAGETKNPERSIPRSVVIATPLIALMFILGTATVLAFVPRDQIDLVSPIPQTLRAGVEGLGVAAFVAPVLIVLLLTRQLGALNMIFAGNTRLPMVAGWDGLLPSWFTRLHPKSRTPVNSIVFVGAVTLVLTLGSLAGAGTQEAFQLLENAGGIFYAMAYVALFAIPLFGARPLRMAAATLARRRVGVGPRSDGALLGPVDLPDHRRPELAAVRAQGGRGRRRRQRVRRRHLRGGRAPGARRCRRTGGRGRLADDNRIGAVPGGMAQAGTTFARLVGVRPGPIR